MITAPANQIHPEQILTDKRGRRFMRIELNGHWVEYRYLDDSGRFTHAIAFPRVPLITDEVLDDKSVSA